MENINDKKTKVVNEMMAGKYLDPKADLTFKLVSGQTLNSYDIFLMIAIS